jgi:tRNA nucleotidyltransferase/poly(A) polymerase
MPDYIYLLENRLSPAQQSALQVIREAARHSGMTVFLTGGAVRDLTSGSPVRDLDVSVQGKVAELKPSLKQAGAVIWGEHAPSSTLFARFPGGVRVEVSSTRWEEFPKPAKPVYHPGSILEDLRRRDFTANAMALSLNEGSYGLLLDPLNGVADLEGRLLRLVSNYGFLEDPVRLIRAARLKARLGWDLEEKTKARFDNARAEGVTGLITPHQLGYEVQEIVHEEDGLKILKALEADGWMKVLFPAWTSAKADAEALDAMREVLVQLQMQGVNPDPSAAQAQLLTAKLPAKDLAALKKMFVRQGFVKEWEGQEERAKEVAKRLLGKEAATPSAGWKLLTSVDPEAVLWLGVSSKNPAVQQRFQDFFTLWPESRARIPYAIMQEMRITPELPGYQDLVKSIFFELIDGKLTTEEEVRQFLEPHSPPAPPPPVTIRRTRAKKGARSAEAREIDDDETPTPRSGDDDGGDEIDEESELGDERAELIARSALVALPEPEVIAPALTEAEVEPISAADEIELAKPAKPAVKAVPDLKPVSSSGKAPAAGAAALEPAPKPAPLPEKIDSSKTAASKAAPPVAAPAVSPKSAPPRPVKAAPKVVLAKTPAKTPLASKSAKAAPAKPLPVKPRNAKLARPAAKSSAKSAPAPKKAPAKKAASKPAASGKLRKVLAKPRPAKAIVKSKPAVGKAKSAVKSKPAKKAVLARKKR